MPLLNERLHIQYGLTHNLHGVRCHHYSDGCINDICSTFSIPGELREKLWEYLDVKAAFYLRARDHDSFGTAAEHRKVVKFVHDLVCRVSSLAEDIQKLEDWTRQSSPKEGPSATSDVISAEDRRRAEVFRSLAAFVASIQLPPETQIPIFHSPNRALVAALLEYANSLEPIALIDPPSSPGREIDINKRFWVSVIVSFWTDEIGRKFATTCKPEEGKISPLVQFVYRCVKPIETHSTPTALAKLIKKIGQDRREGTHS